jgi:hypothetical protein
MRRDWQAFAAKSSGRAPFLALIATIIIASGSILAFAEPPQPRPKPKAQQHQHTQPAAAPVGDSRATPTPPVEDPVKAPERPGAIVVDSKDVSSVLGKEVRSAADENMGRIVDVIVDQRGQVRAAIIDFGGFLGVGSRKIAVDWKALNFSPGQERNRVILQMTREQVTAAPEYQEGKPIFVLSAAAGAEPVRYTTGSPGR